jgi:hypothetical protein
MNSYIKFYRFYIIVFFKLKHMNACFSKIDKEILRSNSIENILK